MILKKQIFVLALVTCFNACLPEKAQKESNEPINIHATSDAATLNPVAARDELSQIICLQLYQPLMAVDFKTEELVGIVATKRPEIIEGDNNTSSITYTIRPEAQFDDGSPITANDVLFSLKLNVCPLINNVGGANYYGFITSVTTYKDDPLKITFNCDESAVLNEYYSSDFAILPEKFYDKNYLLRQYNYTDLLQDESLASDSSIIQFAQQFNADEYAVNPNYINGSGPYKLKNWNRTQNILIERKEKWWGNDLKGENSFFITTAKTINYEIINDPSTALVALKSGKIDFMGNIPARDFLALNKSKSKDRISTASTNGFGYQYIGMNLNNALLANLSVRKAIAYAVPKKQLVEKVYLNQASLTNAPLSSARKELYNKNLNPYSYNIEISKKLLSADGWKDNDKDGVLEKVVDGQKLSCKLRYHYNTGNEQREAVGLILKDELKKVGISLEVIGIEWSVYLQKLRNGEIDLFFSGIVNMPIPPDFTSYFHSSSANGGRNYANYQNPKVDSLIVAIRKTSDKNARIKLIKEFQQIVNEDLPYLFLLTPKENLAYSNKLKGVKIYGLRPNFWPPELSWK